ERRYLLGEKVDNREGEQRRSKQGKADGYLTLAKLQVEGDTEFAFFSGFRESQDKHSQRLHGKAPHHAKRIGFAKQEDVAAAQYNSQYLQAHQEVDNPVGGPKASGGAPEPLRHNAVLGNPVQHSVRADDRSVGRTRQH